jgi:D-glycero-alpha-D-manno-heptose 1-phosphate guanylyltransferase
MDIIILAGGLGTRLREVVPDIPKPLAPVSGHPFLDAVLDHLDSFPSVERVIMAIGYRGDAIKEKYQNVKYRFPITFSVEESLLGTGGAVKHALAGTSGVEIVVMNGDTYTGVSIDTFLKFHREKNGVATIAVSEKKESARYGAVVFDDTYKILSFKEKNNPSNFVSAGAYVFQKSLFDAVPDGTVCSLEQDLFPRWLEKGMYAYIHREGFHDIGTPEAYAETEEYLKARKKS